mgnify:CR=1 FL=1
MDNKWVENDNYFEGLSRIIEETERGGVEIKDELPASIVEVYEEGVDEGLFKRDKLFDCPNCDRTYSVDYSNSRCDCGFPLEQEIEEDSELIHTVQYYHDIYPGFIRNEIGDEIEGFNLVYRDDRIDEIPASGLHPASSSSSNYIHISPYFHSEVGLMPFPGYSDIFISWSKVRDLIIEPDDTIEWLSNHMEGGTGNGDALIEDGGVKFQSGLNAPDLQNLTDSPWYTMQSDTSPEIANRRARAEFNEEYYNMFEKLAIEYLGVMFPHAIQLEGGKHGVPEPDGYLHTLRHGRKQTYLVESKCYSSDFKIFSESDKNRRYVDRFISDVEPETDYNLIGCLYIATQFDTQRTQKDIDDAVSRSVEERNLDIICINDQMMRESVERLRQIYRKEPSSKYRIYKETTFYSDLLQGLSKLTAEHGLDTDRYNQQILDLMEIAAKRETTREDTLRKEFERQEGYEAFRSRMLN